MKLVYNLALSREPDNLGIEHFKRIYKEGKGKKEIVAEIVNSDECKEKNIDIRLLFAYMANVVSCEDLLSRMPLEFIRLSFKIILNRVVEIEAEKFYLEQLRRGISKESVLCDLLLSDEAKKFKRILIGIESLIKKERSFFSKINIGNLINLSLKREILVLKYVVESAVENNQTVLTQINQNSNESNLSDVVVNYDDKKEGFKGENKEYLEEQALIYCEETDKRVNELKDIIFKGNAICNKILVIKGDLRSYTGYSKAARAYYQKIKDDFDLVLGIDSSGHASRNHQDWPTILISENDLMSLVQIETIDLNILSISGPDAFKNIPGAKNIGLFFWETNRLGNKKWIDGLNRLDEVWVPLKQMKEMLIQEGCTSKIIHKIYPLTSSNEEIILKNYTQTLDCLELVEIGKKGIINKIKIKEIIKGNKKIFLCTSTLIPRKGIPLLIREWIYFSKKYSNAALVFKLSTIDVTKTDEDVMREFMIMLNGISSSEGSMPENVYLITTKLTEEEMKFVEQISSAFITTSLGEGLGLGGFGMLVAGKPLICPCHTSFKELLPDYYPYFLKTQIKNIALKDPAGVYPISSEWGVIEPGSVVDVCSKLMKHFSEGFPDEFIKAKNIVMNSMR